MLVHVLCYMCYVLMLQQFSNLKQISPKGDNKCYLDLDLDLLLGKVLDSIVKEAGLGDGGVRK